MPQGNTPAAPAVLDLIASIVRCRGRAIVIVLAAASASLLGSAAAILFLAPAASASGATLTTFTAVGESTFTVPAGVSYLTVAATGAEGGGGTSTVCEGGRGALATGTLPVIAGEVLYVEVGGAGGDSQINAHPAGGANGGGAGGTDNQSRGYYGGGGGGVFGAGGGAGSSFIEPSATGTSIVTAAQAQSGASTAQNGQVQISYTVAAPSNTERPAINDTSIDGQPLTASTGTWSDSSATFTYQWQDCDSSGHDCSEINGATSSSYKLGAGNVGHTLVVVVTATNMAGSNSSTSLATAIVQALPSPIPPAPVNTAAPVITGTAAVGHVLSVSTGSWSANTTGFQYQWLRDEVPISGATHSSYTVQTADQGHALTSTVTASDGTTTSASTSSSTSPGVTIPIINVQACPRPTGRLSGTTLGPITLGLTQARARRMLPRFSVRSYHTDNFCLSGGWGIRVGYASAKLLGTSSLAKVKGKIVLALTANPYYTLRGVRQGTRLSTPARQLKLGKVIHLGANDWYVIPGLTSNSVLKIRHGVVWEIGIANKQLTTDRATQQRLLRNF